MKHVSSLAAAFCLLAVVSAACGGGGGPSATPTPAPTATPSPTMVPDSDGDGIADPDDACPLMAETARGADAEAPDGCPETLMELLRPAIEDLETYWNTRLRRIQVFYESPLVVAYTDGGESGCGPLAADNALYCPFDHSVYYDESWLDAQIGIHGDFAPIFVMAHEWGHVVQEHIGFLALEFLTDIFYSIDIELQADCFAGVYARDAGPAGLADDEDASETAAFLRAIADDASIPWFDPGAHGTAEERTNAFMTGFGEGLGACSGISDPARERTPEAEEGTP